MLSKQTCLIVDHHECDFKELGSGRIGPWSSPLIAATVVGIDSLKAMDSLTEDLAGDQLLGVRSMNAPAMMLYIR